MTKEIVGIALKDVLITDRRSAFSPAKCDFEHISSGFCTVWTVSILYTAPYTSFGILEYTIHSKRSKPTQTIT